MGNRRFRRFLSCALVTGLFLLSSMATQAAYPEKPVNLIASFPSGGATDMMARTLAESAKKYFPKPIVVINRPGAGGTIGCAEVMKAKPDGYTLGITASSSLVLQPHRTKLPYGSPEGYTPVIKLAAVTNCLVVQKTAPWKNIQEFIAYANANPGKIRAGHSGIGTSMHLNMELLMSKAGIDLTFVPFAGGGEVVPALLGGHIDVMSHFPGVVLPHVRAGKVRVLLVFEDQRNPLFPEAPCSKEIGYEIALGAYHLIFAPKGLSPLVLSTLHNALKKSMEDPAFTKPMETGAFDISYEGPEDLKKRLMQDYQIYGNLVDRLHLKE